MNPIRKMYALLSFLLLALLIGPSSAWAFSIDRVTVLPSESVTIQDLVTLRVDVTTPNMPASLFSPTRVQISGNTVYVELFVTDGMLTALGSLTENVSLGTLPAGQYNYKVHLTPSRFVGWGTRDLAGTFTVKQVTTVDAPTITGFWPGVAKPGSMVAVFGSNFVPRATQVAVNGVNAPIVQVIDDTLLVFMLPSGVTTGPITVTTAAGNATSSYDFGVPLTGLQVTGMWPAQTKVYSFVIVFGSGFDPGFRKTKVNINGLDCPIVQVVDPSLLFFLVPPGATSGPVAVEVNGQTATSNATLTILP